MHSLKPLVNAVLLPMSAPRLPRSSGALSRLVWCELKAPVTVVGPKPFFLGMQEALLCMFRAGTRIKVIALAPHSAAMCWWKRLGDVARIYKVATLPIAVLATGATTARLYQYWNPEGYAQWYLWNVAARRFKEPAYRRPWVDNAALMQIIREALRERREEGMTLLSSLQMSGKTSAALKECHDQGKVGFFVGLGDYTGKKNDEKNIEDFVITSLISNRTGTTQGWLQWLEWLFFPQPLPATVWQGLRAAFERNPQRLVLVADETQVLANDAMQHSGILNHFCAVSAWGSVVLVASEYAVAQHFKAMTHIAKRTKVKYSPAPTADEMRPYVQQLFAEQFGPKVLDEMASKV